MEKLTVTDLKKATQTKLEKTRSFTPTIPTREQHAGLLNLINRIRKLRGWGMLTATDMDAQIQIWHEQFARYRIPEGAYRPLLNRAIDRRQEFLTAGKPAPELDAELLISCWPAIKENFGPKELPSTAQSDCGRCYGSGMAFVEKDGVRGVTRCDCRQ